MSAHSLHQLLDRLSDDGTLTDEEFSWLAERLESDADARAEYIRWRDQEANLHWDYSGTRSSEAIASSSVEPKLKDSGVASILDQASRRPIPPSLAVALLVLAAVLVGLALWPMSQLFLDDIHPESPIAVEEPTEREYVGRLVRSIDARWTSASEFAARFGGGQQTVADGESPIPKTGSRLFESQWLFLSAGVAEIYFDDGAEVILEGPAVFRVQGRQTCRLEFGKMVGHCPDDRAKGFAVQTPLGRVVDLGTEFGVNIDSAGDMDIAVFAGKVAFHPHSETASASEVLTAGEAMRCTAEGTAGRRQRLAESVPFIRRVNGRWAGLSNIVAGYQADYIPGVVGKRTTARRWRYLWNEHGPIGDPANYVPLVWNKIGGYTPDAEVYPLKSHARFARLVSRGGHPGIGSRQPDGDGVDHYVIAAYVVETPGHYELVNVSVVLSQRVPDVEQSLGVVVHVDAEAVIVDARIVEGVPFTFDVALGHLKAGQVVYVAVGPDGEAGNDGFRLDFSITRTSTNSG